MTKLTYKRFRQAIRTNGLKFGDFDTCLYWANGDFLEAYRLNECLTAEPDHLMLKALRLNSGGKLVKRVRYDSTTVLTIR